VPKYLIVNADDLGISVSTNLAIGRGHRRGMVTSASLMANMPALGHAAERILRPNPELGVGVHLCLTSGRPLLAPGEVPLLVGRDGSFAHGFPGLIRLLWGRRRAEALAQVEREWTAQAGRIDALGFPVDHVDSHQHVHMIPGLFALAVALARARQAVVRVADEPLGPLLRRPSHLVRALTGGGLLKKAILSCLAGTIRKQVSPAETAHYFGVLDAGRMTIDVLRRIVRSLPEGISEVNLHPGSPAWLDEGLDCSPADRRFLRRPERIAELEATLDPGLLTDLLDAGIRLVRFRDVFDLCAWGRTAAGGLGLHRGLTG
jgi:predicted glycoside hydrolase/deacetylase ChbG (UPF0249 family)